MRADRSNVRGCVTPLAPLCALAPIGDPSYGQQTTSPSDSAPSRLDRIALNNAQGKLLTLESTS